MISNYRIIYNIKEFLPLFTPRVSPSFRFQVYTRGKEGRGEGEGGGVVEATQISEVLCRFQSEKPKILKLRFEIPVLFHPLKVGKMSCINIKKYEAF